MFNIYIAIKTVTISNLNVFLHHDTAKKNSLIFFSLSTLKQKLEILSL